MSSACDVYLVYILLMLKFRDRDRGRDPVDRLGTTARGT